jgi:hypothetical protein
MSDGAFVQYSIVCRMCKWYELLLVLQDFMIYTRYGIGNPLQHRIYKYLVLSAQQLAFCYCSLLLVLAVLCIIAAL